MIELAQANWPIVVAALVIAILLLWALFIAMRRTAVKTDTSDVLDEGKGPANRNQALIDAPPAAVAPAAVAPAAVAPQAPPEPSLAAAEPATLSQTGADDLSRIKGVGPKLVTLLNTLGISRFDQIANWSETDIDAIDGQLGRFEGRIRRDNWIEQAKLLAADDTAGYESKFGAL